MEQKAINSALRSGVAAASAVVDNWEGRNLAVAVRDLGAWRDDVKRQLESAARAAIDERARRLCSTEVSRSVSHLISKLLENQYTSGFDLLDENEAHNLAWRPADADDYEDAHDARSHGYEVWHYIDKDGNDAWAAQEGPSDEADGDDKREDFDSALEAWQWVFEETGQDQPEGCEAYEHWLVSDWLADLLRDKGESVVECEALNLTVWARCTTGQAIYADGVFQRIARDLLEGGQ